MDDIVPKLLELIEKSYNEELNKNSRIDNLIKKIANGDADYETLLEYANELGKCLENAFKLNISDDVLPDGKMYYNIAQRIVEPFVKQNYDYISNYCVTVQNDLNTKAGLGLKGIKPDYNLEKTESIINYISNAENYSIREKSFLQSLSTNAKSIVDDSVKQNAEFHYQSGLSPKIIRRTNGKCCKWCQNIAGKYNYSDVKNAGNNVFRRHANCNCSVVYDPGNGAKKVQDVWSKNWNNQVRNDKIELAKRLNKEDTIRQYLNLHSSVKISIPAKKINVNELEFDDNHINKERGRDITKDEAINWINNSLFSINVWNNSYERFFSEDGAVYVDLTTDSIKTAYRSSDFTDNILKSLEVLK